jgi:hypothetical protein|tara:strand:- start:22058 stop:22642 length:585 start_codon:yes stop_codon:yes gene_type:complete
METIAITLESEHVEMCYGWDDLVPFQGGLKDLTNRGYDNLASSLKKNGFFVPVYIWKGASGEHAERPLLIDGHQRQRVFQGGGFSLEGGLVPTIPIQARSAQHAAELLLRFDSQHGTRTHQGMYQFVSEHALPIDDLADLDIADYNHEMFKAEFFEEVVVGGDAFGEVTDEGLSTDYKCPKCHYEWSGKAKQDE